MGIKLLQPRSGESDDDRGFQLFVYVLCVLSLTMTVLSE